ncbi:uncharacterized protein E5676_scaffold1017G00100 [Cucumis melo var. makuwa]|uniref:Plant transposase n=1 Tax=Cucumis melo var. makuwa TaxID=1194695 RepID=A0A5D3CLF6_CUCMM|nr:uncharacterized protein E5676_scaffold1017G00100 [Cucumis melo var. makuwa]
MEPKSASPPWVWRQQNSAMEQVFASLASNHLVKVHKRKSSLDSSSVTMVALWTKAHKRKDGQPMNSQVAKTLSINDSQTKCKLLDWYGSREIVAEGKWSSNDPTALVHHVPIGPHAIRVWVDVAKKPNAHLWRPT